MRPTSDEKGRKPRRQLDEWFVASRYKRGLTLTEWYREISNRTLFRSMCYELWSDKDFPSKVVEDDCGVFRILLDTPVPDWAGYHPSGIEDPIQELSIAEAIHLTTGLTHEEEQYKRDLQALKAFWDTNDGASTGRNFPPGYETQLYAFLQRWQKLESLKRSAYERDENGNYFLSCGRPLSGYPLTIDIQFDDETLTAVFQDWLKQRRRADGEKARRPFNENDTSDWEQYRVREVFDLQLWARVYNERLTDRRIAELAWGNWNKDISPIDILVKTTRKKVDELFRTSTQIRFYGQLRMQLGDDFLTK